MDRITISGNRGTGLFERKDVFTLPEAEAFEAGMTIRKSKNGPCLVVCMGVSGSGKTTVAKSLASHFGLKFIEADDYQSEANKAMLKAGYPLTDTARRPWIQKICRALSIHYRFRRDCVLACSCLLKPHRDLIRDIDFRTLFLFLEGDLEVIKIRLIRRKDHYMNENLLESQFHDLQDPAGEGDVVSIDINTDLETMLNKADMIVKNHLENLEPA
jgi:gluconokinase